MGIEFQPRPLITIESMTFSDGSVIELGPTDIIAFVGPNNAGKSAALREIESFVAREIERHVVIEASVRKTGSLEDLEHFLQLHATRKLEAGKYSYEGMGFNIPAQNLEQNWENRSDLLASLFCRRMATENRIVNSNPAASIDALNQVAQHPIHILYTSDEVERRMNEYFNQAFGQELTLHRGGGNLLPLFVGPRPALQAGEDRSSTSYLRRLEQNTVELSTQGDGMRSFASVILEMLAPSAQSMLMLDEPEAFLHPPQAKLLGEILAENRPPLSQLFLATHSEDVLHGLLNVASEHLRIIRLQREGTVNRVKELENDRAREISTDPLMKFSSVLAGVFHARVIICESDADCMFYSSVLDLSEVHGEQLPDVLFVHANGKHRMADLAQTLRQLGVTVDVIADIDVLDDLRVMERLALALECNWNDVREHAGPIKTAIEALNPPLSAEQVRELVNDATLTATRESQDVRTLKRVVDQIFRRTSPWGVLKSEGVRGIPDDATTEEFDTLWQMLAEHGLWVVRVGELEGFCRSVPIHGPRWAQTVLETRNLATDPELEDARAFMRRVWTGDAHLEVR